MGLKAVRYERRSPNSLRRTLKPFSHRSLWTFSPQSSFCHAAQETLSALLEILFVIGDGV